MRTVWLILAAIAAVPPASAQPTAAADTRINQLVVYGDDPCPQSNRDEITVCARKPENERYRIPEALRTMPRPEESWVTRAEALEYVGRTGIGSCSPVGPGGASGCFEQLVRQARAERANGDDNWARLVEEARQERLGRIDAQSEAVERELREQERQEKQD